jgi:hypothetical protein
MKPDKTVLLAIGQAVIKEMTVRRGIMLLEAVGNDDLSDFIFMSTDKLVSTAPDIIIVTDNQGAVVSDMSLLTPSEWDDIGNGFVEVNSSFLGREALKRKKSAVEVVPSAEVAAPPSLPAEPAAS